MLLTEESQRLLSAALRHVRDAEHLADSGHLHTSLDQAFHLAGYGPECARKAVLASRSFDKLLGHSLALAAEPILELALAFEPLARRYGLASWEARYPALVGWSEQSRYERTGTRSPEVARQLVAEARHCVDDLALALWADGRLRSFA